MISNPNFVGSPALLTAQNCADQVHLIIGSGPLAASRCLKSLEVGAKPILIAPETDDPHFTLTRLVEEAKIQWTRNSFKSSDLRTLGRQEVDNYVDAVFVTTGARDPVSVDISQQCKRLRIPVNVVDAPDLCTFTLLSTHSDGPLQIGITTSGRGCKLSSRIRREIASVLPPRFGEAIERLGIMRKRIWEEDYKSQNKTSPIIEEPELEDDDNTNQKHTFNTLVKEADISPETIRTRRMRWLSQICEYWPLARLAAISDADVSAILTAYKSTAILPVSGDSGNHATGLSLEPTSPVRKGTIFLAGSGPGHPSLLTIATHNAIKSADYILADKLVPAEILALIPRRTPVHIARKFPGNADAAQEELLELGLKALKEGKKVLRLKQGDPYLYGRGAEEVKFFRQHQCEVKVIPGVTSALSAPLFAEIPVTHRATADEVVICTGTGRKGAAPEPPSFKPSKTIVFLMALHRLESLVQTLTTQPDDADPNQAVRRLWPKETPCTIIERASCPDQRVIRSTLEYVCRAVEVEGSRPPGLLVLGRACGVLHTLQAGQQWVVEEGFHGLDDIESHGVLGNLRELEMKILTDDTTSKDQKFD